jgi:hypothetical protein
MDKDNGESSLHARAHAPATALHTRLDALLTRPPAGITVEHVSAQPLNGVRHPAAATTAGLSLPDASTLLKAKIRMAINRLMATYLSNWEETADQHDEAMGRLIDALPAEQKANVVLADSFGETRFEAVRRHVLKTGNDSVRDIEETIDNLRLHT